MVTIEETKFNKDAPDEIKKMKYGSNWPVVYIINSAKEAYVGETVNASIRAGQHLQRSDRQRLNNINIISDDDFNKSVILDLENFLINHMSADGKFELQNISMGNTPHHYYQQDDYEKKFNEIWMQLKNKDIVQNTIHEIENSDIFKYSPYKNLSLDQYRVVDEVIQALVNNLATGENLTAIVEGGAGTGKTVLGIYLMKILSEVGREKIEVDYEMDPGYACIAENINKLPAMKIGMVIPMQSLRATVKKVFKNVKSLKQTMVLSPVDVPKDTYDLLIVDESHRLRQRKALAQYPAFDKNNRKLGFGNEGTELDWIFKCSKNQIFFYDAKQSVKPSDVDKSMFEDLKLFSNTKVFSLNSQFRCAGGDKYIDYIKKIISDNPPEEKKTFKEYDFKIFDDVKEMTDAIKEKDKKYGLCRTVAGYSWKWASKDDKTIMDIHIDGYHMQWNSVNKDWVNSPNALNEVGCIHTVQGYDLNYAGVIFGNEIGYDPITNKIYVDKSQYFDMQGKTSLKSPEALKDYIMNIYTTLLTRGIRGTYVYACNRELQEYLKKFIEK